MDKYKLYIYLIISIKVGFIIMALLHIYLKLKKKENSELDKKIIYWKGKFEFIFIFLMSILLIYLFNPRNKNFIIDYETKILLYLFGFILLITADWTQFFHQSKWLKTLQSAVSEIKS